MKRAGSRVEGFDGGEELSFFWDLHGKVMKKNGVLMVYGYYDFS